MFQKATFSGHSADFSRHAEIFASCAWVVLEHSVLCLDWNSFQLKERHVYSLQRDIHRTSWGENSWTEEKTVLFFQDPFNVSQRQRRNSFSSIWVSKRFLFGAWILTLITLCRQCITAHSRPTSRVYANHKHLFWDFLLFFSEAVVNMEKLVTNSARRPMSRTEHRSEAVMQHIFRNFTRSPAMVLDASMGKEFPS